MADDERYVSLLVQPGDVEDAISCVYTVHSDRCITHDRCGCHAEAARLQRALDEADTPKMIRETLSVAQTAIGERPVADRKAEHLNRLQRLMDRFGGDHG